MLTTARYIYHKLTHVPEFSLVILGLNPSTKTSLLHQLTSHLNQPYVRFPNAPSVGVNLTRVAHSGISLCIKDFSGEVTRWKSHTSTDVILYVIDQRSSDLEEVISGINTILTSMPSSSTLYLIYHSESEEETDDDLISHDSVTQSETLAQSIDDVIVHVTNNEGDGIAELWESIAETLKK
ncbi:hypothetical protein P9112_004638 [Eukaryota sp. TZLM1-RC]